MSCDRWVRQISLMLSESLGERDTAELKRHLGECPACRAELILQTEIENALAMEAHSGLSADFAERVSAKARRLAVKSKSPRPWPVLVPPLATAAAAAALFFLGMNIASQNPSSFEQVAGALLQPLASLFGVFSGLFDGAAKHAPALDPASGRIAGLAAALLTGAIPAFWGLRRFLVYFR